MYLLLLLVCASRPCTLQMGEGGGGGGDAILYGATEHTEHWHATNHTTDKRVYQTFAGLVYPWYTVGNGSWYAPP